MNIENKIVKVNNNSRCNVKYLSLLIFAILLFPFYFTINVSAQVDGEPPADVVPPPLRKLSSDELKLLDAKTTNIKKRTQVSLDLMDARMANAERFLEQDNFTATLNELGVYQGILNNALSFLIRNDNGKDRVDKNFKTLEICLRKQIPKLESIRRVMPYKYGYYVQVLMKDVRDARSKAIEPLFDDTVVPNNKP